MDQRSVEFMFDGQHKGKVKNEKIVGGWSYHHLNRILCTDQVKTMQEQIPHQKFRYCVAATQAPNLAELHCGLCHPGVTRMTYFLKSRNLPFSVDDV